MQVRFNFIWLLNFRDGLLAAAYIFIAFPFINGANSAVLAFVADFMFGSGSIHGLQSCRACKLLTLLHTFSRDALITMSLSK